FRLLDQSPTRFRTRRVRYFVLESANGGVHKTNFYFSGRVRKLEAGPGNCQMEPAMVLMRFHVFALAVALLLPISGVGFAAQEARHSLRLHSRSAVVKNQSVITSRADASRMPAFYSGGTSSYPWGPGRNFPYPDRPYGDPDRY